MKNRRSQHGFSLTEVLIAMALFAIIFVAALMIYDTSNRVFKSGVEAADMQQNTRVAYDKIVSDLRMAGYDYDRDGVPTGSAGQVWKPSNAYTVGNLTSPTIANGLTYEMTGFTGTAPYLSSTSEPAWPTVVGQTRTDGEVIWTARAGINQYQSSDEQFEYAGTNALTIRGNFDFEKNQVGDYDKGREPSLENAQFPVVTTANDEIVTYALRSNNAAANTGAVEFFADVFPTAPFRRVYPGGAAEQRLRIPNVDLTNNNPPYTLYRFTFDANGAVVESPLANNIRSLSFTYYRDATGLTVLPITGDNIGGGQYNPNTPALSATPRSTRAQIQSVRLELIGMNEAPEPGYTNPAEATTSLARQNRTYRMESLIVPRNIGKQGFREPQAAPPGAPILQKVFYGYCGLAEVTVLAPSANPDAGTVEQYAILYDTVNNGNFRFVKQIGTNVTGFVELPPDGTTFYIGAAAVNSYGSTVAVVPGTSTPQVVAVTTLNRTTPSAPTTLTATGTLAGTELQNQIKLDWDRVFSNVAGQNLVLGISPSGALPSEVRGTGPGEISRYRILRHTDPNFTPATAGVVDVSLSSLNRQVDAVATASMVDFTAANCVDYYYRIQAVEACETPASRNVSPAVGVSGFFPTTAFPGIKGRATSNIAPKAPTNLAFITTVSTSPPNDIILRLNWKSVTEDMAVPANPITVFNYILTRQQQKNDGSGNYVNDGAPVTVAVTPTTTGAAFTAQDVTFDDTIGGGTPPETTGAIDENGNPYRYEYTVEATQCGVAGAPSLPVVAPCTPNIPGLGVGVSGTLDGNGTTAGSAYLLDGSGSAINVVGTNIASVSATMSDGFDNIDLGTTVTGSPYTIPIVGTEDGIVYAIDVVIRDTAGCTQLRRIWVEESTPSGCCLSAFADNPLIVQYTPGTKFVTVLLQNDCFDPLSILNNATAIRLAWNPVGAPVGTMLTTVEFPAATGTGVVPVTLNRTVSTPVDFGLPVGARTTIAPSSANTPYRVVINFSQILTSTTQPMLNFCVGYQRAGVDTVDQRCRIIPEPSALPTDFNTCN